MALNTTTLETNLNTKMNATTGTTEGKEFLLLGKAVEALTPTVTVQSVIAEGTTQVARVTSEGTTQVAAVQAAASGYAPLADPTFTGTVNAAALTLSGNLTVNGTTTTVNSTTLDVADLNITIADGAADAAAANGAGITVDGASATILYTSATDTWDFNKAITGNYNNLQPTVDTSTASTTHSIDYQKSMQIITMSTAGTFSLTNAITGAVCVAIIDTTTSPHTPTFHSSVKWPYAAEPTWASYRYWVVSFTCVDGVNHLASASPYTI